MSFSQVLANFVAVSCLPDCPLSFLSLSRTYFPHYTTSSFLSFFLPCFSFHTLMLCPPAENKPCHSIGFIWFVHNPHPTFPFAHCVVLSLTQLRSTLNMEKEVPPKISSTIKSFTSSGWFSKHHSFYLIKGYANYYFPMLQKGRSSRLV
jgi:hypothetical protein